MRNMIVEDEMEYVNLEEVTSEQLYQRLAGGFCELYVPDHKALNIMPISFQKSVAFKKTPSYNNQAR